MLILGNYNPYAPIILGQEWAPIREENTILSPTINSVEVGHEFTLAVSRILQSMRFYVNQSAPQNSNQVFTAAIYAQGTEAATGPIRSVLIPVNNGGITGTGVSFTFATNVATALGSADDAASISFVESGVVLQKVGMFFAVNSYPELTGKRILAVNLRYVFTMDPIAIASTNLPSFVTLVAANGGEVYGNLSDNQGPFNSDTGAFVSQYGTLRMGEINPVFDKTSAFINRTSERLPWTYSELQRFEASAANRLQLLLTVQLNPTGNTDNTSANFSYAALEVFFCEEQRLYVASGKRSIASAALVTDPLFTGIGVTVQPARAMGTYALNPTIPPGDYSITLSSPDVGDYLAASSTPQANALREYYAIPPHHGVQVNIPAPVDETKLGETFTSEQTHVLPQLSVHTSGGPLTEVHVYGRQAVAQVYGSIVAEQNIFDDVVGVDTSYTQVRFIARRWGNTTQSLDFAGLNALSTSTASITVADFDALDEIINGWKLITLRLSTPAVMGTRVAPDPVFRWSSAAETAGNRWEILGAIAPALSGLPGNLLNKVASPHQLSVATYGQPTSGDTVALSWVPGYSPAVTASTADQTADAFLMFSTDPPAVSGFAVSMQSQAVTGIGPGCVDPCCIPTEIHYNEVVWSPLSLAASGFGYYELQRMDSLTDWATIMKATDLTSGIFNDYEARVGMASDYRIRAVNVYEFAGPWSSTVSESIEDPGVEIECGEGGHLLIFTSNSAQSGSVNLAYSTVWEGAVNEDFDFPEAGDVIIQKMYGKDFVTAFRPLERGGERFTRTVLVQAAAIPAPTLGDFTSLRDMAWEQLPYVCVRDEDGNRWFATILVPSGRVQLNRTLYMAPVTIMEVTDTPFPVDP